VAGSWVLYADMGNSSLLWAVHDADGWGPSLRMVLAPGQTARDSAVLMHAMLESAGYATEDCSAAALLSSNPSMTGHAEEALASLRVRVLLMGRDIFSELPIDYHDPSEMGQDRVAAVQGARALCGVPVVAITCGTCITAQALSATGRISGGPIAPGLTPLSAGLTQTVPHLAQQTAEAARMVEADEAIPSVGHSTVQNLAVGLVTTLVGVVSSVATSMRTQVGEDASIVLTGGLAPTIARHAHEQWRVEPLLTLEGLRAVRERTIEE